MNRKVTCIVALFAVLRAGATGVVNTVCKTEKNAVSCYTTHGRLAVYNGGFPNLRLWKIGTHRLLGIYSGPYQFQHRDAPDLDTQDVALPANVNKIYMTGNPFKFELFADFEVCPLEPLREDAMQASCVASAKHLFVKRFDDD